MHLKSLFSVFNNKRLSGTAGQRPTALFTQQPIRSTSRLSVSSITHGASFVKDVPGIEPLRTKDLLPPNIDPRITQGPIIFHDYAHYWLRAAVDKPAKPLLCLKPSESPQENGLLYLMQYSEGNNKLLLKSTTYVYGSTYRVVLEPPLDQWRAYGLSGGVRLCDTASGPNLPERYKKRDEGGLFVTTFRGGIHHIPEACLAPNVAACELPESHGHAALRWDPGCVFTARRLKLQPIQNMVR